MWIKILLVFLGGGIGATARYGVSGIARNLYAGAFPLGTFLVNLAGSFVIGLLWGMWEQGTVSQNLKTFVFVGVLGGFTTFSSFSLETLNLFRENEIRLGLLYVLGSNILGLAFVWLGFVAGKMMSGAIR